MLLAPILCASLLVNTAGTLPREINGHSVWLNNSDGTHTLLITGAPAELAFNDPKSVFVSETELVTTKKYGTVTCDFIKVDFVKELGLIPYLAALVVGWQRTDFAYQCTVPVP